MDASKDEDLSAKGCTHAHQMKWHFLLATIGTVLLYRRFTMASVSHMHAHTWSSQV